MSSTSAFGKCYGPKEALEYRDGRRALWERHASECPSYEARSGLAPQGRSLPSGRQRQGSCVRRLLRSSKARAASRWAESRPQPIVRCYPPPAGGKIDTRSPSSSGVSRPSRKSMFLPLSSILMCDRGSPVSGSSRRLFATPVLLYDGIEQTPYRGPAVYLDLHLAGPEYTPVGRVGLDCTLILTRLLPRGALHVPASFPKPSLRSLSGVGAPVFLSQPLSP